MRLKIHKKYRPLWDADYDYAIITGGRGSGKSFAVGDFIENLSFERGHTILYTRYTLTSAHLSVIPEFQEKISIEGHINYFDPSKTEVQNKRTGVNILFRGIRTSAGIQTAALKSIQGLSTWVLEEVEELVEEDTFDKIDESVRQAGVKNRVIMVMNPATKEHWIYKRFFEEAGVEPGFNGIKNRVLYIHTDYRNNIKNLSQKFLQKVAHLKKTNPSKYKHRILGGWIERPEGVIFENWKLGAFDNSLPYGHGLDFGFTDPDSMVKVAINEKLKLIYIKQLLYETGQGTQELIRKVKKCININDLIIAESASPRIISDMQDAGLNVEPVVKNKIIEDIKFIQDYELIIDPDSSDLVKELNMYAWSNKKAEIPIDAWNHLLDATRYIVQTMCINDSVFFI